MRVFLFLFLLSILCSRSKKSQLRFLYLKPNGPNINFPKIGAAGLIRKDSLSLFRCLEDVEPLIYGSFDELGDFVNSGFDLYGYDLEREILF